MLQNLIKLLLKSVSIAAVVLLFGCASTGNKKLAKVDSTSVQSIIKDGVTTKAELERDLGQPSDIDFDNHGNEKWTYTHKHSKSKASSFIPIISLFSQGTNDENRKLVVIFDKDNKVSKHVFSQNKGETTVGVFG